jgi:transposase-like protein
MGVVDGRAAWTTAEAGEDEFTQVVEMLRAGKSYRSIQTALSVPKSTVARMRSRARERGLL